MAKVFKVGLIGCGHIAETYFKSQNYFNNILNYSIINNILYFIVFNSLYLISYTIIFF